MKGPRNSNLIEKRSNSNISKLRFKIKHCNSEVLQTPNNDDQLIQEIKKRAHQIYQNPQAINFMEIYDDFVTENKFESLLQQARIYRVLMQQDTQVVSSPDSLSLKSSVGVEDLNSNSSFNMSSSIEVKTQLPKLSITDIMREKKAKRERKLKEIINDNSVQYQSHDDYQKFQSEFMMGSVKTTQKKMQYHTDREVVVKNIPTPPLPKSVHTSRPPVQDLKRYQNKIQSYLRNRDFVMKMKIFLKLKSVVDSRQYLGALAEQLYSKRSLKTIFEALIVVNHEEAATQKQYQIVRKIKVFRELVKNKMRKQKERCAVQVAIQYDRTRVKVMVIQMLRNNVRAKERLDKCYQMLKRNVISSRRTRVARQYREQYILRQCVSGMKSQTEIKQQVIQEFQKTRLLKYFCAFIFNKVKNSPMSNISQIKCSRLWVQGRNLEITNKLYHEFCEKEYEKHLMTKVIEQFCQKHFSIKIFQKRNDEKKIRKIIKKWQNYTKGNLLEKQLIEKTLKVRQIQKMKEILEAWRKTIDIDKKQKMLEGKFAQKFLRKWRDQYQTRVLQKRLTNKFLQIWIQKMDKKLHKKQLYKHQFKKAQKIYLKKFMKVWVKILKKEVYLNDQLVSISQHQNDIVLSESFNKLLAYKKYRSQKNVNKSNANQLYTYRLGKKVWFQMIKFHKKAQQKNRLYAILKYEHDKKLVTKIIQNLKKYAKYKKLKTQSMLQVQSQVQKITLKFKLKLWRKILQKTYALKFLQGATDAIRMRNSLKIIRKWTSNCNVIYEVIKYNHQPYLQLQVLKSWFNSIQKRKQAAKNLLEQYDISLKKSEQRAFKTMLRKYRKRVQMVKKFQWTMIMVKRAIQSNYFREFKAYARYKKIKRRAHVIYQVNLVQKCLYNINQYGLQMQKCRAIEKLLTQNQNEKIERKWFAEWIRQFHQNKTLHQRVQLHTLNKVSAIFISLHNYKTFKQITRHHTQILVQKKQSRGIQRLKQNVMLSQQERMAKQFHQQYVFESCVRSWFKFYRENKINIKKQIKISKRIHYKIFKMWVTKSQKTIEKMNKFRKVGLIMENKVKQRYFVDIKNYSEQIQKSIESLREQIIKRIQKQAFTILLENIESRKLKKQQYIFLQLYSDKVYLTKSLKALIQYKNIRKVVKTLKNVAKQQNEQMVKSKTLASLVINMKKQRRYKKAEKRLKKYQIFKVLPRVLDKFAMNAQQKQRKRQQIQMACNFQDFKLQDRVIRSLGIQKIANIQKKLQNLRAISFYQTRICAKLLTLLVDNCFERKKLRHKRSILFSAIQKVDHQNLMNLGYESIFQFCVTQSHETLIFSQKLRYLKKKRLFEMIVWNRQNERKYQEAYQKVEKRGNKELRKRMLRQWRAEFMKNVISRQYFEEKKGQILSKCFESIYIFSKLQKSYNIKLHKFFVWKKRRIFELLCINKQRKQVKRVSFQITKNRHQIYLMETAFKSLIKYKNIQIIGYDLQISKNRFLIQNLLKFWHKKTSVKKMQQIYLRSVIIESMKIQKNEAFQCWKRQAFFVKMYNQFQTFFDVDRMERPEIKYDILRETFKELKINKEMKQNLRGFRQQMRVKMLSQVFENWKKSLKGQFFINRIKSIVLKRNRQDFDELLEYAEKEAYLTHIESNFVETQNYFKKSRILVSWAKQFEKREIITAFKTKLQICKLQEILAYMRERVYYKKLQKIKQKGILNHFICRPHLLNSFQKLFLTSDIQCHDLTLQKYILDKWRLSLSSLKRRNNLKTLASENLNLKLKQQVFNQLFVYTKNKQQVNTIKANCDRIYSEKVMVKTFEVLKDYVRHRQMINQQKSIVSELKAIRQGQQIQKIMLNWYDLTVERIQNGSRYEEMAQDFNKYQKLKILQQCLQSLRSYCKDRQENHKFKLSVMSFADDFYYKNLAKKTFNSLKKVDNHEENLSKLYGIFQAWKFYVKENQLLKKYLVEAEQDCSFQNTSREDSMEQTSRFQRASEEDYDDY